MMLAQRKSLYVTAATMVLAVLTAVACTTGVSSRDLGSQDSRPESGTRTNPAASGIHGSSTGDRLDDSTEPSLRLEDAIIRTGPTYLPDEALTGKPVKIVLNETVEDPSGQGRVGLMVLYESGVKLITEPGAKDLAGYNESFKGYMPFRDGRKLPYRPATVAGRPALVAEPGVQYSGDDELETPANVVWNIDDVNYWLKFPTTSSRPKAAGEVREVSLPELVEIAGSMRKWQGPSR